MMQQLHEFIQHRLTLQSVLLGVQLASSGTPLIASPDQSDAS
jgi:hypothetical protein